MHKKIISIQIRKENAENMKLKLRSVSEKERENNRKIIVKQMLSPKNPAAQSHVNKKTSRKQKSFQNSFFFFLLFSCAFSPAKQAIKREIIAHLLDTTHFGAGPRVSSIYIYLQISWFGALVPTVSTWVAAAIHPIESEYFFKNRKRY